MKNKFLLILFIMLISFSVLNAANPSTHVSLDLTNLVQGSLKVKFTKDRPPVTGELDLKQSNYLAYDSLNPITHNINGQSKECILLKAAFHKDQNANTDFYAESVGDCYISWQTYLPGAAVVYLTVDGPLKSITSNAIIHWSISMSDETHNKQTVSSRDKNGKLEVLKTIPGNFGVTGSRKFIVQTESLLNAPFESYTANIIAKVEVAQ